MTAEQPPRGSQPHNEPPDQGPDDPAKRGLPGSQSANEGDEAQQQEEARPSAPDSDPSSRDTTTQLPVSQQQPAQNTATSDVVQAGDAPQYQSYPLWEGDLQQEKPTDEQILDQENQIRAEAAQVPFIGDLEPMDSLRQEYVQGSAVWVAKIDQLAQRYRHIRRARGDGNCFFRSFLYAYIESLIMTNDLVERNRFLETLQQQKRNMLAENFQEIVLEDPLELVIALLEQIGLEGQAVITVEGLLGQMRDQTISNYLVMLLRLITSCEIRRRTDFFEPFILGSWDVPLTVDQFCQASVEPMSEESDHIHIIALTDALQIPIRVIYLDHGAMTMLGGGTSSEVQYMQHDFGTERNGQQLQPRLHLLYRPGHYDILYLRNT